MRSVQATLCILVFSWAALAQSDRGSITGAIADAAGSSIPGASVTATNEGTGAQNHTATTGAGEYTIPELPAGTYSVTVEAPGFTKLIHSGITVSVNLNVRLDLTLNDHVVWRENIGVKRSLNLLHFERCEESVVDAFLEGIDIDRVSEIFVGVRVLVAFWRGG